MGLVIVLEFDRFVTLMPVQNQYSIWALYTRSSIFIEVFQPFQTRLIICPPVTYRFDNPVAREVGLGIPVCEVINALNSQKWRNIPTFAINTNNRYYPFPIAWLYSLSSATLISMCNNYSRYNQAYQKASLVKEIEITIYYTILCLYILYQLKPRANQLRIFI